MKVQEAKEQIKLRGWAMQIDACNRSGLTVRQWCSENGVATKTYYYHVKRVREEILNTIEIANALKQPRLSSDRESIVPLQTDLVVSERAQAISHKEPPVFAALSMPKPKGAAVTVRVGAYAVEIQNGADETVVEQVLKVVARI